jgi:hypothetical protein
MAKLVPLSEAIAASGSALSADEQEILKRFIDRQIEARDGNS